MVSRDFICENETGILPISAKQTVRDLLQY